jgi:hypothetical protein
MEAHRGVFGRAFLLAIVRHAQELLAASVALVFALAPIAALAEENSRMPNHDLWIGGKKL